MCLVILRLFMFRFPEFESPVNLQLQPTLQFAHNISQFLRAYTTPVLLIK